MTTFESTYDFIELNRTFRALSVQSNQDDDTDISQAHQVGSSLGWPDLIKEYRVVILSEAGSGKTTEIRNAAQKLNELGKRVFFLRLENIVHAFEDAFEFGTRESFEEWLESGDEGWIFLDSVDEARLRDPGDFELAIRKMSRLTSVSKDRAHLIITSRTTSWRPKTDLELCSAQFPYAAATESLHNDESSVGEPDPSRSIESRTRKRKASVFKIVALENLSSSQVESFLQGRGVLGSNKFIAAIERADAWTFTTRPQDLEELIEFWIDNDRIGSRLEIMRNSVERRLIERDQARAEAQPLAFDQVKKGAKLLAAAATLTQDPNVRVPDGASNSKGIPARDVLADWNDRDQKVLLSRPIFDEEIYGAVRFHHRSVREYLTSEWIYELLSRETSRRAVESLFFRDQYGLQIVVPTLRPILPWLLLRDEKIQGRVLSIAPEIVFEGGDPSQLPFDIRRDILCSVCQEMAHGAINRRTQEYTAVQRFANTDLAGVICSLINKYIDKSEVVAFLMRMVQFAEIHEAKELARGVALNANSGRYARIESIRVIKVIGTDNELQSLRQSFEDQEGEFDRDLLAELIEDVPRTEDSCEWILRCLEKVASKERFSVDYYLSRSLKDFITEIDVDLLPDLTMGFSRLLSHEPVIDRRFCEVSKTFEWLSDIACIAVIRLASGQHPATLTRGPLDVLHKISSLHGYQRSETKDLATELSKIVSEWIELNRALFWYEVKASRTYLNETRGNRLTNFWEVSPLNSLWSFSQADFDYLINELASVPLEDDKLVALSLLFQLYMAAKRPRTWLGRLKKAVEKNEALSSRLAVYLKPPAQSEEMRRLKRQSAKSERIAAAHLRKQEADRTNWRNYLQTHLDEIKRQFSSEPGTLTNSIYYLSESARRANDDNSRWTGNNWKTLIPEFGEDVARVYREACVMYWQHHDPQLRSEGAPLNQTTVGVIVGLTGLAIDASETVGWPRGLSTALVKRACKHASFELNGFPSWFPKLFLMHPSIVGEFLMQEIQYELAIEESAGDTNYILSDVAWSGQWAWDYIAPSVLKILGGVEPKNVTNLDNLLRILQGSNVADTDLEALAATKCHSVTDLDHLARWFAVWVGVLPDAAITSLSSKLGKFDDKTEEVSFAMNFVTNLLNSRGFAQGSAVRSAFKTPAHLKSLYLLMEQHIRSSEDIERAGKGAYSPGLRDNAQDARNALFQLLNNIAGKESLLALIELSKAHPNEAMRPWMLLHAKTKAELEGDIKPWSATQVREFHEHLERTPSSHVELADLAVHRFLDLKDDLEHGDTSVASILSDVESETHMRNYIGHQLREKAFGRYSVPQEEELADAKRPDLRFLGRGFDGPVPIELKLADNWTGPVLFERLENQLCGDYLRDNRSSRGLFVLVYRGEKKSWEVPETNSPVDFTTLTINLQEYWQKISLKFPNVDAITVIGIDLTKRTT